MATIQWFPGHMAKARREIQEQLKLVDLVIEICDARIPESSRNPMMNEIVQQKPHLLVLNKTDLADPKQTKAWQQYYEAQGQPTIVTDAQHQNPLNLVQQKANEILKEKLALRAQRGIKNMTIRAMCMGVPNSGKSTFLNRLVGKNVAVTGNRPGVTKNQNWLKTKQNLEILDTPGILWPKFDDQEIGVKLALTGAIKEGLYHEDDVTLFALDYFRNYYPQVLTEKLGVGPKQLELSDPDLLLALTKKFGFKDEYERMAQKIIFDLRKGSLGRITLEQAPVSATEA
ncbi:ribosome biogenesis GTP-binding protein YlqF [Lapidilactobacillus dextrinicus DSM 20335]|uniref:Ribosome biogenesis GTPase A n=1 Tax=Lapidilactobacillus dextrinicus DSM 20335 TaxID=1423738 RepID=A0A0R2BI62_9LACO|nr:ribosome biogenesis GTPase YlqF [Lapidilactobacillus dextrinicus]KRM79214.1 ribosome biogenesis GTP-binding protein YlqF [Lapidilactobacillus dextrinicus DSM 20335]QFG46944.1 ribosome biogenesis GTPase YlqF [Lapidilactobacillus dextrinicus]